MKTVSKLLILLVLTSQAVFPQSLSTSISVDVSQEIGEMRPFWSFFGYDEPNYTYMQDGQKLLTEIAQLSPVPVFVRTHNLLTTKEGEPDLKWGFTNAYTEDEAGNPIYDWTLTDKIMDSYIERKMKPLVEIGFMPKALSTKSEPYQHQWSKKGELWTGWTYPPKDYTKWAELVYQWVIHSIERYGEDEVKTWLWEVWNEPDIGYWSGSFEEYCKLYDYAVDAVKRACSACTVGGPHTTNPNSEKAYSYLVRFLEHCLHDKNYATGKQGAPLEFVAFHAKGNPKVVNSHIRMNMGTQLEAISRGFEAVNSYPELKDIPIIIGECDPEGCAACSQKRDPKYGYRNGTVYSSYTASSFAKIYELMDTHDINLHGVLSWAFEFENQEWFASFRDLSTNGVNKPILNIFRMFGMMNGKRVKVEAEHAIGASQVITQGVRLQPDIDALACKGDKSISVMVWNYHDDDVPGETAEVALTLSSIEHNKVLIHHYAVDQNLSNSFEAWKSLGSPQHPTAEEYAELERAGRLQLLQSPEWIEVDAGKLKRNFSLPRQGVALIRLTWD
jgi:xylan 1,4-beta-xylosidase